MIELDSRSSMVAAVCAEHIRAMPSGGGAADGPA